VTVADDVAAVQRRIAQIAGSGDCAAWAAAVGGTRAPAAARGAAAYLVPEPSPRIDDLVRRNAARWRLEPALLEAVIANESAFDPAATSPAGAQGLMQLMPATAAALGVRDPFDPAQNVAAGARYLRSLVDRFGGDVRLALAAYNAGPGAVENHRGVPPYAETQRYIEAVLASRARYRRR
jgi:soluble lytic murein transglycosylase-like protein